MATRPRVPALAVALALTAAACTGEDPPTRKPPQPVLSAVAAELQTVPPVGEPVAAALRTDLAGFLTELYSRALLPPITPDPPEDAKRSRAGSPSPDPTPIPRPPVEDLFLERSRGDLAAGAFRAGPGVVVQRATVRFSGVATVENDTATSALLAIDVTAHGVIGPAQGPTPSAPRPKLRLRHAGQIFVKRTGDGWRVAGFDVSLIEERSEPAQASPAPAAPTGPAA